MFHKELLAAHFFENNMSSAKPSSTWRAKQSSLKPLKETTTTSGSQLSAHDDYAFPTGRCNAATRIHVISAGEKAPSFLASQALHGMCDACTSLCSCTPSRTLAIFFATPEYLWLMKIHAMLWSTFAHISSYLVFGVPS